MAHHTTGGKILKAKFVQRRVLGLKLLRRSGFVQQREDLVGAGDAPGRFFGIEYASVEQNFKVPLVSLGKEDVSPCFGA